eukprot:COSAG01_NODE_59947_length_297_cov_0.914141_1_plen_23_part_10
MTNISSECDLNAAPCDVIKSEHY